MTKVCPRCSRNLPASPEYWHRNRARADGYAAQCKECWVAIDAVKNGKRVEAIRRETQAWYSANRDRKYAVARIWEANNRDKRNAIARRYRANMKLAG